jgi:hypothetical protein
MLSWVSGPLQSGPRAARARLPGLAPPALSRSRPRGGWLGGAPGDGRTRGQADLSRNPPALLRFSTRTCPRFSRRQWCPVGMIRPEVRRSARTAARPKAGQHRLLRERSRGASEDTRRQRTSRGPEGLPPRATCSPHTTLSKRNLRRAGPFGANSPPAVMLGLGPSAGRTGRLPVCSPPSPLGIGGSKLAGSPAWLYR